MRKLILTIVLFFALANVLEAQTKFYNTTSGELIFGFSNAEYQAPKISDLPNNNGNGNIAEAARFTLWFHFGTYWHYNFNNTIGIYSGIANRNIGFVTMEKASLGSNGKVETTDNVKWKRRAYAIGVPLVLKLGSFEDDYYFFLGAQYELLYHYKEKEFLPSGKRKYSSWFSNRVNRFLPSIFVGFTLPKGTSFKFTYYLNDMMNKEYSYNNGSGKVVSPYKYLSSRLFYFSVFQMVRWDNTTLKKGSVERKQLTLL